MSIHYKFKSALEYDTITFDGLHISVKDLKSSILQQKRIGKNSDFDLQVTNAQTKEVYSDDDSLIPKNTSLLIARVPLSVPNKGKSWEGYGGGDSSVSARLDDGGPIGKQADLSSLDASEDDKIRAMISQSTQEYDPSNYLKVRGANQVGPVPPNYRCYKCHLGGHWIKDCPLGLSADSVDIKKSTGIPKSFMREVAGPDVAGAMITPNGSYAVHCNTVDATAQVSGAQTADGGANTGLPLGPTFTTRADIPEDLICSICDDLLVDAVMIPCCGNSFCDECVRNSLLESEEHECPDCHERDIAPTTLIPNRFLRKSVATFKNESGYVKKYREPRLILPRNVEPIPADSSVNNTAADNSGKTIISEADSTESAKLAATNDVAKTEPKEETEKPQKPLEEQQPPIKPISTLVQQEQVPSDVRPITNVANTYRENRQHGGRERERTDNNGTRFRMTHQQPTGTYQRGDRSPRPSERPKYRRSPQRGGLVREERSDTPTIDEPGLAGLRPAPDPHRDYAPPPGTFMNSEPRPQQLQGPPMQGHPPQMMPQQHGPPLMQLPPPGMSIPPPGPYGGMPPQQQQQQLGAFVPGMPPNFRLPPPGAPPPGMPPYMPGPYSVPPRPMFDGSRGPPPMVQAPLGAGYPPSFAPRGRPIMPPRRTPPNMSIIDDPLEAFNRILREKDERRRRQQQQAQQHRRSYSRSRSSSRSYSRSPQSNRRGGSRSPPPLRCRRGASRSPPMRSPRSFTISRSRSRSRSPSPFRDRDRDYSPPPSSYHHHPRDHHRDYRERAHGSPPPPLRSHDSGGSYGGPPPARHFRGGRRGAPRYRGALGSRSPPPSHLMTGRNASPPPPPQRGYGGRVGGFKDFKDSERGGDSRHNFESSQSHYAASQQPRDLRDSLRDLRGDRDQRQSSPQQRRSSRERSPPPNRRGGGFSPGRGAALLETPRHAAPQQDSGDSAVRRPRSRDREKEQRDRNRNRDRDRERERNRDRVAQDVTGFYPPPAAIQGAVPVVAPLPAAPVVPPGVMDFNSSRFAGHYAGPLGTEQPLPPGEDPIPPPQSLPPPQIIPQPQQYQPLVQQLIIPPIQHYDQQQSFLSQNQQPIPFMQHALPSQELAYSSRGNNRDDNRKSRYERHDRNRERTPPTNRDKSRTSSKDNYDSPDRRSKQQRSRKDLPVEHSPKGRKDKDYSDDDKKSRKAEKKKKKDKKEKDKDPDKKKKKDRKDSEKKEKKKNKEKADASDKEDRKKLIDIKFPEEFKQAQEKQEETREKSAPIQEKVVEAAKELPVAPPEIIIQPEVKRNQLDDLYGDLLGEEIVDSNIVQSYGKLQQDEVMRAVEQPQQLLSEEVEVEDSDQLEDKLEESFESAKTPELKQDVSLTDDLEEASVPDDGQIVEQDFEEPKELEMDVLELHSQDEVEVDKELLHLMPEKSKWETDVIELDQTIEGYTTKHEDKEESKVSSEVLKRAENAIFAKAINAIRPPIEIKKISLDRAKLYSNSNERTTTKIEQDFQVTLKNDHYHEEPSSDDVTIVHDHAGAVDVPEQKPPPLQRLSVKERLGCKVDDLDRIIRIDLDRNRSRSMSPLSKKYMEMQSKPPHRRIEVAKKEDRTRYSSKDKDRHARSYRNAERSRSKDKKDESSSRKKTISEKPREKSGDRKKRRSRSKSRDNKKKDTKRVRKEKEKPTKSSQREKEEPQPSKRSSEAKVDRAERSGRGGAERQRSAEPAPPGTEDSPPPAASLLPPLSTGNKKAVEKQRKATIDEASFEPDYDLESDVEEKGRAKPSKRSTTPQPIRQVVVKQKVKIEQQSSSESSSEAEKKSKKKHKKKSKKRRRKESTSSSSESSSDSDDKKRKKHKKKSKKSKKRKHKDR